MEPTPIAEVINVTHCFRKQTVLDNISMTIPKGCIYGFLGPNGAGKTTTLLLMLGLLRIQKGAIRVFQNDIAVNRIQMLKKTGSLIEQPSLYPHLTGCENLEVSALSYRLNSRRIQEVLELTGLLQAQHKKVRAYSLGMKQRLAIAMALLNDPEFLVLDEPTNGLDPSGIIDTRKLLIRLNRDYGKTILISSHLLSEIEKIATMTGIIHNGKILFEGTLEQLQQMQAGKISLQENNLENQFIQLITSCT